jgi:hypothetical protein
MVPKPVTSAAVIGITLLGSISVTWSVPANTVKEPVRVVSRADNASVIVAPALQRAIHQHFPGYAIPPMWAFDPDLIRYLSKESEGPGTPPQACVGDFDGNGRLDAALFLSNQRQDWLLVAFHQTVHGSFQPYRLDYWPSREVRRTDDGHVTLYLAKSPAGSTEGYIGRHDQSAALRLKHDGITEGILETSSKLYFFRRGRYRHVWTSD